MKKQLSITQKMLAFILVLFGAAACISETETPLAEQSQVESAELEEGGENLKKGGYIPYEESFVNQITPFNLGTAESPLIFLPGTGEGKGQGMGKVYSFINQVATSPTTSEGAPVTQFHEEALAAFGLTDIPDDVHSVTVSENGTAIFYSGETNIATFPDENGRVEFEAVVHIVGGTKKFKNAKGEGKLTGSYHAGTGQGTSKIEALIQLN
ncbi:hypothetical protein [Algoriphagus sp.]|uniref:hypothetical protein n=1 Tax=Algoriphagus sp. TaxID=1872435 RepID=UPI00261FAADA|nr:hypothetical protein [Algoriphagus sp.]